MATKVTTNFLNVVEQAKRRDPSGDTATIAENLTQLNEILLDAPMYEANDTYSHLETIRDKLPVISPRTLNNGASRSASGTHQERESIMLLDVFAEIDEGLIDHEPDPKKALVNEIKAFLEAAMQEFTRIYFYGNPGVDSREALGLATRFNTLSLPNVYGLGGGGGDTTSVWVVEYGELVFKLIFPRGSKTVGIQHVDGGKIRITGTNGGPLKAYSHQIKMEFGLSIARDTAIQRLTNIESSGDANNLLAANAMRNLVYARNHLPNMGKNAVIYGNRDTKSQFDIFAMEKTNGFYTVENITGEPLTTFQGTPIRMAEQILSTEAQVT